MVQLICTYNFDREQCYRNHNADIMIYARLITKKSTSVMLRFCSNVLLISGQSMTGFHMASNYKHLS